MKIRRVTHNNRKGQLELTVRSGKTFSVPYAKLDPRPTAKDRIREAYVDKELGNEAVSYVLESGAEGALHIEHALEYNQDPSYLAELMIHNLTVEAQRRADRSGLSRRELARRLGTSVTQLYRLLDPANTRKSLAQLLALLHVLDCEVQFVINPRSAARTLARRKLKRRLHPDKADRLFRVARIAALAEETLGGREQAARWLKRPNRALGNAVPLDHLDTDLGAREVEDILGRISHGVYS